MTHRLWLVVLLLDVACEPERSNPFATCPDELYAPSEPDDLADPNECIDNGLCALQCLSDVCEGDDSVGYSCEPCDALESYLTEQCVDCSIETRGEGVFVVSCFQDNI